MCTCVYTFIHSHILFPFRLLQNIEWFPILYTGCLLFSYFIYSSVYTEKAMAPHSSTLAWKIPWMKEPGRLQSMGSQTMGERLHFHFSLSCIGEGNGNPLQCSCLENPRDGGTAIYGVTQSQTWLKQIGGSSSSVYIWIPNFSFIPPHFSPCVCVCVCTNTCALDHFSRIRLFVTLWTI